MDIFHQTVSFLFLLCLFILSPSQTIFLPALFSIPSFFRFYFLFHPFLFIYLSIFCATLSIPFFSFISSLYSSSYLFSNYPLFHIGTSNSITPRFYIPPINILECATNSNREGEPIIRNEGINQSRVSLEGNKIGKKEKKYRNIDGSNVIITQSPRNSNARREIVSSHRDPTASEDAAKHDRIGRPDKTSNLLSRPFLIGLLLLPTSSTGSTARIIYAKLM